MKNLQKIALTAFTACGITLGMLPNTLAQGAYKLSADKGTIIKILGTSNVHDWTMASSILESQGNFKLNDGKELTGLSSLSFSLAVKSLKSEHESMDSRTYKTVNADKYPKISYKLNAATVTALEKNKYLIKATGDLTISGTTQTITMNVTAVVNPDHSITCSGSAPVKLTDYKIDPPSFMLGAMKVKNDLNIQFNLIYKTN